MSNFYMYTGLFLAEDVKKYDIDHVIDVRTKVEWDLGHFKGNPKEGHDFSILQH